ncbi:hypothetical protein I41_37140 [Lacipirellula limnantheis]|uniref:Uncharacterized protein n=1 Tax=Lacipirellula limnantheis TaxID=2528024 RepID=A0A517U1M2_9BACT|nr:hypothetical protein I41_37140 [Lacipirellula limnantheis]
MAVACGLRIIGSGHWYRSSTVLLGRFFPPCFQLAACLPLAIPENAVHNGYEQRKERQSDLLNGNWRWLLFGLGLLFHAHHYSGWGCGLRILVVVDAGLSFRIDTILIVGIAIDVAGTRVAYNATTIPSNKATTLTQIDAERIENWRRKRITPTPARAKIKAGYQRGRNAQ